MLKGFTMLVAFQMGGELIAAAAALPIPGSICGMVLLVCALLVKGGVPDDVGGAADGLLKNMSILFVPAGVGVMAHADLLGTYGWAIGIVLVVSAFVTLAVTAYVAEASASTFERSGLVADEKVHGDTP